MATSDSPSPSDAIHLVVLSGVWVVSSMSGIGEFLVQRIEMVDIELFDIFLDAGT